MVDGAFSVFQDDDDDSSLNNFYEFRVEKNQTYTATTTEPHSKVETLLDQPPAGHLV